jgi:hypothetical protein
MTANFTINEVAQACKAAMASLLPDLPEEVAGGIRPGVHIKLENWRRRVPGLFGVVICEIKTSEFHIPMSQAVEAIEKIFL